MLGKLAKYFLEATYIVGAAVYIFGAIIYVISGNIEMCILDLLLSMLLILVLIASRRIPIEKGE